MVYGVQYACVGCWLVWIIIKKLSNRVKAKFELCEICQSCYQCKLKPKFINLNNSLRASSANLDRICGREYMKKRL